jgi:hypothetical protein
LCIFGSCKGPLRLGCFFFSCVGWLEIGEGVSLMAWGGYVWCGGVVVFAVLASSLESWWVGRLGDRWRMSRLGEGFHALHWNMMSWCEFSCCVWGVRIFVGCG